ncbi:MAG: ribonuclease R [Ignavibacteria bacterium]|nr:ribonuclease R [Ignavibacteria bacterium]
MLIIINYHKKILELFSSNKNASFKLNSILKKLELNPSSREILKKNLQQLVKEGSLSREGKYYSTGGGAPENLKFKLSKDRDRSKKYSGDRTSGRKRSGKERSGDIKKVKSQISSGEIDFGDDGRAVIKSVSESGEPVVFNIKGTQTFAHKIGDKVNFSILTKDNGSEAEIIEITSHKNKFVTGKFEDHKSYGLIFPDSREIKNQIIVSYRDFSGAKNNDKVYAEILNPSDHGDEFTDLRGKVIEVLGQSGVRDTEERSIMRKFGLEKEFPQNILEESEKLKIEFDPKDRLDLRDKVIFTIDPEDAKDFDDAVSIEKLKGGNYLLGVHIADVSHFVKEDSELDKEALRRATSTYLVKNVIPMLPEKISNELCSLKPNEDRLTFSILITLSRTFKVKSFQIVKTVINSKRRFTYEEAQQVIETGKGDFVKELQMMDMISKSITLQRLREESLDFDSNEVKFRFDKHGSVSEIVVKERINSMRLIEEFMLLANKCATEFVGNLSKENKIQYPFIYRVHDIPNSDRMKELADFVKQFGYTINPEDKTTLRKLLNDIEGKPEEFIINDLFIRSMAKAIYQTKNIGHYGLGFKDYSHFTSPIRRYPDLAVHRCLFDYLSTDKIPVDRISHYEKTLSVICKQSSIMEQNAEKAERESIKLMQIDYISKHLGSEYEGIISGMIQYGIFVEIMDILIEGMIRFRDMNDDYYEYDDKRHIAVGRRKRKVLKAGQKVRIKVIRVNKESRKIDFALVN